MERARQTVVYLDTHVIVWLYAGEIERFSSKAKQIIETHPLYFSPLVEVELKYLHEINEAYAKPFVGTQHVASQKWRESRICDFTDTWTQHVASLQMVLRKSYK